jgi:hypothetical protein
VTTLVDATTTAIKPTTDAANPVQTVNWFMWRISSVTADLLFSLFNWLLVFSALAVFVGTIGAVTLSGVRELFTNGRISANERATIEAKAELANATLGIAKAQVDTAASNAVAAKAELETERLKKELGWRELTPAQIKSLARDLGQQSMSISISCVAPDAEASNLEGQLLEAFRTASLFISDQGTRPRCGR